MHAKIVICVTNAKSIFVALSMIAALDFVSSCKLHALCNKYILFALVTQITIVLPVQKKLGCYNFGVIEGSYIYTSQLS